MSTTNLFIELVVVGVGAAIWVCLLILAGFGYEWVPVDKLLSPAATVPMLALVYLLGIVTDRTSDTLLGPRWARGNRARVYGNEGHAYAADKALVLSNPEFAKLFEYNKSRQRICRGWAFNAIAILLSLHAFLWFRFDLTSISIRVAVLGTILLLLLACGCWYSGRRLNRVQYQKVKEQSALLRASQTAKVPETQTQR
jgi:hypothetical protein